MALSGQAWVKVKTKSVPEKTGKVLFIYCCGFKSVGAFFSDDDREKSWFLGSRSVLFVCQNRWTFHMIVTIVAIAEKYCSAIVALLVFQTSLLSLESMGRRTYVGSIINLQTAPHTIDADPSTSVQVLGAFDAAVYNHYH